MGQLSDSEGEAESPVYGDSSPNEFPLSHLCSRVGHRLVILEVKKGWIHDV